MRTSSIAVTTLRVAFIAALLTLTPLALSPDGRTLAENRATCATGQCVFEAGAVCAGDGHILYDYYSNGPGDPEP